MDFKGYLLMDQNENQIEFIYTVCSYTTFQQACD